MSSTLFVFNIYVTKDIFMFSTSCDFNSCILFWTKDQSLLDFLWSLLYIGVFQTIVQNWTQLLNSWFQPKNVKQKSWIIFPHFNDKLWGEIMAQQLNLEVEYSHHPMVLKFKFRIEFWMTIEYFVKSKDLFVKEISIWFIYFYQLHTEHTGTFISQRCFCYLKCILSANKWWIIAKCRLISCTFFIFTLFQLILKNEIEFMSIA